MTNALRLLTLGPLAGRRGERTIPLGGPAQQAVLARLVVAHPGPADLGALTEACWGESPPTHWRPTLQAYVSRLRKLLAPELSIEGGIWGYRLVDHDDALDSSRFVGLVRTAERYAGSGRAHEVQGCLTRALSDWRSPPALQPFDQHHWAASYCVALGRLRLRAHELLAESYLTTGDHQAAEALLDPLVADDPQLERSTELLMLARYRAGRQVEALDLFHHCRTVLQDDLGLDPSPRLTNRFRQILRHDTALDWRPPAVDVPRILPPRAPLLVGRDADVRSAQDHLRTSGAVVLHGLPGVGKTSLAAELAHRHEGLVCWVPAEDSAPGLAALTRLAAQLGVSPMLGETELLPSLWRRLADWPGWMLVFDNVEHGDRIRTWLPPDGHGQIVVTSRTPALSWLGPAQKVEPLDPDAARTLVRSRLRRPSEPPGPLADAMGGIALALEQACSYIDETQMSIDRYIHIFTDRQRDLLNRGAPADHPHPVTATWEIVLDDIAGRSPLAVEIMEVCSFLSGDELSLDIIEAIGASGDPLTLEDAVAELIRYSLLDRHGTSFRLHRLVQQLIRARLGPDQALDRVRRATGVLASRAPATSSSVHQRTAWSTVTPHLAALLRAVRSQPRVPDDVLGLVLDCVRHLRSRLALEPAHEILDLALQLVRPGSTGARLAELHVSRADILDAEGHLAEARAELDHALQLMGRPGRSPDLATARIWSLTAHILNCSDEAPVAIGYYRDALAVLGRLGEPDEVVTAHIGLGYAYWSIRQMEVAEAQFRAALELMAAAEWQRHPLHPEAVSGLGMMLHEQGRVTEAIPLQRAALAETDDLYGDVDHPARAYISDKLGWELGLAGRYEEAIVEHQRAADVLERLFGPDDPRLAMMVSNRGQAEGSSGRPDLARESHLRAYRILTAEFGAGHRDTRLVAERLAELGVAEPTLAVPA